MKHVVDLVTVADPPSYSLEVARRLREFADCRLLVSRSYAQSQIGMIYRLVGHPFSVSFRRRRGALLHLDSQSLAYLSAYGLRQPIVITCLDILDFLPEFDDPSYVSREGLLDRAYYRLLARGLRRATRLVAISEYVRSCLVGLGFDRSDIDVVPMGVDPRTFYPRERPESQAALSSLGVPADKRIILFIGSEHPRKNFGRLLRAFAQLNEPNTILVKVGAPRYPQRAELQRLAVNLGIKHQVLFLDRVSDEIMPLLYSAAEAFVLPSLHEGFGVPPIEAMASGTPVALSKTTSLPEVAGEAALYFDPRSTDELATALGTILTNPQLRAELRIRGLERAALFPWGRTVKGILESYDRAASKCT